MLGGSYILDLATSRSRKISTKSKQGKHLPVARVNKACGCPMGLPTRFPRPIYPLLPGPKIARVLLGLHQQHGSHHDRESDD